MQKLGAHVAAIGFTFYTDQHVVGLPEQHGGRGGAPVVGQTALRSFDLKSGAAKGTYPFPTNGGVCNDMAVSSDGTVYATESFNNLKCAQPAGSSPSGGHR